MKCGAKVADKAATDADFRARLVSDPKGAIRQELGITIPETLTIEVHEESAETAHLVLPPDGTLSEGDLQQISGGFGIVNEQHRRELNW